MIPRGMTAGYANRPVIDESGSTHYTTHWKWFTSKGRKEMLAKRARFQKGNLE